MLIVGILLLVIGARIYRLIIVAPDLSAVHSWPKSLCPAPRGSMNWTLVLGIVGAMLLTSIEKLAISIVGALLTAGLVSAVAPLVMGTVAGMFRSLLALWAV